MPPLRRTGADREAEEPDYAGEYRLQAVLGAGGMGVVHLATSASGLRLAVKVVHEQYAEDPEFRARFRQEVAAARRVSGAFTAPVVDADPDAERPWMATLYVPGPTLADQVKRSGPLSPAELRRLTAGLAEALRDIHRAGVVHRDLKPSNVLLTDSGPKVIDFGISRPVDSDLHTETGKLIGSPPFMAPEQFQRPKEVGPAADVFALGSVLVHAATGHGPFDSDSPYIVAYQVVHDDPDLTGVPEELAPLVARCLAKEPAERPTPAEIMAALLPPSYEATAFIPAQRRSPAGGPGAGAVREMPAPAGAWDADTPVRAEVPRAGRGERRQRGEQKQRGGRERPDRRGGQGRRGRRVPIALGVLLAVAAGGTVAVLAARDARPSAASPHPAQAATSFTGWQTALGTAGGGSAAPAAPACAFAEGALYCSAPGIDAARLDAATGRVVWSRPAGSGAGAGDGSGGGDADGTERPTAPVVLPGGTVAVTGATGELRTYAAKDGTPGWRTRPAAAERNRPAGAVVVLSGGSRQLRAVDGATGRQVWRHALPGHSAPQLGPYDTAAGLLTVYEPSADGTHTVLSAVRPATGTVAWQHRLKGNLVPVAHGSDGALVLAATYREIRTEALVHYDPDRREARRVPLPYRVASPSIAVRGSTAYLLDALGRLTAVDLSAAPSAGRVRWELETGSGNVSALTPGPGERLYLSASDGRLIAVDTARGSLLAQTAPRLSAGRLGYVTSVPAPVAAGERVYGTAPDGSVFAVDGSTPDSW
ncbi:serine/threonine-protein kinase [Streptomyces sp. NPDC059071]|uniref:serine/threonine-protein kinase n=1 Tax=unclassified Streptomyces TaxID=2593676 RepID=UPI0036504E76